MFGRLNQNEGWRLVAMTDFVALIMTLGGSKSTLGRLKRFLHVGQG